MAIQDQIIATRAYRRHVLKENSVLDKCRLCKKTNESIQHITSGCEMLVGSDYLHRHNNVAKIYHKEVAFVEGMLLCNEEPYYKYKPLKLLEVNGKKLYWDEAVITDHAIPHNRPDILLLDLKMRTATIIDIAVPSDTNVGWTCSEKIRKYQELAQELKTLYSLVSVRIIPIIISTNGLIPKVTIEGTTFLGLQEAVIKKAQQSVLLDNCRIVRKFLTIN